MRYIYDVSAYDEQDNYLYTLDSGEFILKDNETTTIDNNFTMKNHFNKTKIQVNIQKDLSLETPEFKTKLWWPDPNYPMEIGIHFWINEIKGPTITIT